MTITALCHGTMITMILIGRQLLIYIVLSYDIRETAALEWKNVVINVTSTCDFLAGHSHNNTRKANLTDF